MKLTKKVLYNRARTCDFSKAWQNQDLASRMLSFMKLNRGIGLAAPQIGISRRLFVMDIDGRTYHCFDPEILYMHPETEEMVEGCLSFKNESCIISRARKISVRYKNHEGTPVEESLSGIAARCFQHELDHLDGITMWDRQGHAKQS